MSAWQLYPNHIWPADAGHALVLLVMGLPERRVLGATVVQDSADAAALLARLVDVHGCPATLREERTRESTVSIPQDTLDLRPAPPLQPSNCQDLWIGVSCDVLVAS